MQATHVTVSAFILGVAIAAMAEYIDASIGMGYGTTMTPVLIIIGFAPLVVIPAVLLGQLLGGVVAAYCHHRLGNINLRATAGGKFMGAGLRSAVLCVVRSPDTKVISVIIGSGIVAAIAGATVAAHVPDLVIRLYVAVMVAAVGVVLLARRERGHSFSWTKLVGIALVGALNKALTGGGFGPLVTGGQILSGRDVRNSIGSTTVAEAAICVVAFGSYVLLMNGDIFWGLAASTATGSIIAAPLAALTVKKIRARRLKVAVGGAAALLGAGMLVQIIVG